MTKDEITQEIIEQHIDKVVDVILDVIKENQITVLTGANGVGKSLIRKQMSAKFAKLYPKENRALVSSVSMQLRTEMRSEWGALSTATHDSPWEPTSMSTYDMICKLLKSLETREHKTYLVIDEPEIGMSRETQLGLVRFLKEKKDFIMEHSLGLLIITHSETFVKALRGDINQFVYLDYNSYHTDIDKWLNREVIPTDFNFLEEWSSKLFIAVREDGKTDRRKKREKRTKNI